jgi:TPR repeat protein
MRSSAVFASAVFGVLLVTACGGGGPLPGKAPTVASAIADKAPLVVDWPAGQRTDLEVSTNDGVAVVRVEPQTIKLLRECHLSGSYGFLGVSTKEQVIRLDDAGDVALSLPLRGIGLAADLSGELGTSTALDVALITIGRRRTIRTSAARSALKGGKECIGATHYIRGFDVGAFVLATAEKSSASTVAGMFGAKASYARKSAKAVRETDGNLEACKTVQPGDKAPPAQCSSALRLDLKALDEEEGEGDGTCGSGLVRAAGKCTPKSKVAPKVAFECNPANEDECRAQCEAGNAPSCAFYAMTLRHSTTKAPDFKVIKTVAEQGCTGGSERACVVLGELSQYGNGIPVDIKRAGELYEKACTSGEPLGCLLHGALFDRRPGLPVDHTKAADLYDRACRGGLADGCNNLGALAVAGHGQAASPEKARAVYEEACKNGSAVACGNLGDLLVDGLGGPKDTTRAADLWNQACAKSGLHCIRLGDATSGAGPLAKDSIRSADVYQRGMKLLSSQCSISVADRCDDLGWLFHDGRALPRDDAQALTYIRKGCDLGSPEACNHVGMFLEQGWGVAPNKLEAETKYKQSCDAGNLRACVSFALLGPEAKGRHALIERACSGGVAEGCFHQARVERLATTSSSSSSPAGERMAKACKEGYVPACAYLGRWSLRESASSQTSGVSHLETACEKADLRACASLSEALLATKSGGDRPETLARRACDGGVARGCSVLAELATRGLTKQVESDSTALLQRACDGRELGACVKLAERVSAAEPGRAAGLLQRACDTSSYAESDLTKVIASHVVARSAAVDAGPVGSRIQKKADALSASSDAMQMQMLAALGGGSGVQEQPNRTDLSVVDLTGAAHSNSGVGVGGLNVGRPFDDGIDRGRSGTGALAMRLIRRDPLEVNRAIDRADAAEPTGEDQQAGCVALGEMHEKGIGFPADARSAERFYGFSCAHTDGRGCTRLGAIEERAKSKDRSKLTALYGRACELQDGEGCVKAGALAAASSNKAEREEAADRFELACDVGTAEGCLRAGLINESERHHVHALDLFDKACARKEAKGCAAATRLRPTVDAAEAAAAKRRPRTSGQRAGDPTGVVQMGGATATSPVSDMDRVIAGLRARMRNCYQRGLESDPSMVGKLVLNAKIAANGEVSSCDVASNSGLSPATASCAAGVVKRAMFAPPSGGSATIQIPLTCVQAP